MELKKELHEVRELLAGGDPSTAFQQLCLMIEKNQGSSSVIAMIEAAKREMEAKEGLIVNPQERLNQARQVLSSLQNQESLLGDQGRENVLVDAFKDGSSVVCTSCGSLVSCERWIAHKSLWCPNIEDGDE
eukprot:c14379_g1_i1.p1 GENE.c14379_g1_i1~~c14379_g1_i1.p1  ORF type:complete len:131 (+),score=65.45 c14379_g1_i1:36-428(+)